MLRTIIAQVAFMRVDHRTEALRDSVAELLTMDEPRRRFAATTSATISAGPPAARPRHARSRPRHADGPLRAFTLLHKARPVLLNLDEPGNFDIAPWADRVQRADARYEGVWELPAIGAVVAPEAVLIRPDGYVA